MNRSSNVRKATARAEKIRVLIADDHTTFLAGLTSIIDMERDMIVIAQATDGHQAADQWRKHRPNVMLLDLRMPVMDGVGVIDEIRREDASAQIVILTTYDGDNDIYRAIKAGAKGYLLKDARREELLDCIRKVNAGETCIPQALMATSRGNFAKDLCGCFEEQIPCRPLIRTGALYHEDRHHAVGRIDG